MIECGGSDDINREIFYDVSACNKTSISNDTTGKSFTNIDPILKAEDLYICLCPKCKIIPFIEFCENITSIFFTCLCQFQKKIEIKEFFNKKGNNLLLKMMIQWNHVFLNQPLQMMTMKNLDAKSIMLLLNISVKHVF